MDVLYEVRDAGFEGPGIVPPCARGAAPGRAARLRGAMERESSRGGAPARRPRRPVQPLSSRTNAGERLGPPPLTTANVRSSHSRGRRRLNHQIARRLMISLSASSAPLVVVRQARRRRPVRPSQQLADGPTALASRHGAGHGDATLDMAARPLRRRARPPGCDAVAAPRARGPNVPNARGRAARRGLRHQPAALADRPPPRAAPARRVVRAGRSPSASSVGNVPDTSLWRSRRPRSLRRAREAPPRPSTTATSLTLHGSTLDRGPRLLSLSTCWSGSPKAPTRRHASAATRSSAGPACHRPARPAHGPPACHTAFSPPERCLPPSATAPRATAQRKIRVHGIDADRLVAAMRLDKLTDKEPRGRGPRPSSAATTSTASSRQRHQPPGPRPGGQGPGPEGQPIAGSCRSSAPESCSTTSRASRCSGVRRFRPDAGAWLCSGRTCRPGRSRPPPAPLLASSRPRSALDGPFFRQERSGAAAASSRW